MTLPLTEPLWQFDGTFLSGPDQIAGGPLVTDFRFEVLDDAERRVGTFGMDRVRPGGSLSWSASASVKGGGKLEMADTGTDLDWLNMRVRPVMVRRVGGSNDPAVEHPLGVFLPAAPVERWSSTGRSWSVELADKNAILDRDIITDMYGHPTSFSLPAGSEIVSTVVAIIESAGETAAAINPDVSPRTLARGVAWEPGTTRLRVINDLLNAGNYFSLWVDERGQYRVTPYTPPSERRPLFAVRTPFSKGQDSLMAPEWTRDRDIYSVPNRFVAVGQGTDDQEAWVAVAVNTDPTSPFSFLGRRSRWITTTESGIEAADEAALLAYAQRRLAQLTAVTSRIETKHLFMPDVRVNETLRLVNPDAGIDATHTVTRTEVPFDPTGLCSTVLREVSEVEAQTDTLDDVEDT